MKSRRPTSGRPRPRRGGASGDLSRHERPAGAGQRHRGDHYDARDPCMRRRRPPPSSRRRRLARPRRPGASRPRRGISAAPDHANPGGGAAGRLAAPDRGSGAPHAAGAARHARSVTGRRRRGTGAATAPTRCPRPPRRWTSRWRRSLVVSALECDRCGKVQIVNEVHVAQRAMLSRHPRPHAP